MGVPKRKVAHARQMERRSHLALTLPTLVECPHCHEPKLPHRVCPACGWYNGRQAVEPKPVGGSAGEDVRVTVFVNPSERPRRPPTPTTAAASGSRSTRWAATTAPAEVVPGALAYARAHPEDTVILVGDEAVVRSLAGTLPGQRADRPRARADRDGRAPGARPRAQEATARSSSPRSW